MFLGGFLFVLGMRAAKWVNNRNYSFVVSSFINTKIHAKHINKTGFVATGMIYNMLFNNAVPTGSQLQTIISERGFSTLLAAYSNSTFHFSQKFTLNAGINAQIFTLNKHYTLEPRLGIRYKLGASQSLSLAYGLHSRLERLNYYFIKNRRFGSGFINNNLDFTKSHHLVIGYDISFSEFTHLKAEMYYQHLFNVPVFADSSFSIINQQNDWFFNEKLQNSGSGKNYGTDITFEKYLSRGFYYMFTTSVFSSKYRGGDHILRDTRYNRNFAINLLLGKEWQSGNHKQKIFSLNARFCYQGGEHYTPVDIKASNDAQLAVFDGKRAYSGQFSPAFTCHFTATYKINKRASVHEIAIKIINATNYKEFSAFLYNHQTYKVDEVRDALMLPNLSYKIEF